MDSHTHDIHERKQIKSLLDEARAEFATMMHKEKQNVKLVKKGKPEAFHNMVFRSSESSTIKAIESSQRAMEKVIASRLYQKRFVSRLVGRRRHCHRCSLWFHFRERVPIEDFELNQVDAFLDDRSYQHNVCAEPVICPPHPPKYRTENGQCNNLHPLRSAWGSAGYPTERLLPPSYHDGIWEARTWSVDGNKTKKILKFLRPNTIDFGISQERHWQALAQFPENC